MWKHNFGVWPVRSGDFAGPDPDGDIDEDGITNAEDNCTHIANPNQPDTDNDGFGNVCDFDYDNNCATNFFDLISFSLAFGSTASDPNFNDHVDNNGDGFINFLDFGVPPENFSAFFANPPGPSATVCGEAP